MGIVKNLIVNLLTQVRTENGLMMSVFLDVTVLRERWLRILILVFVKMLTVPLISSSRLSTNNTTDLNQSANAPTEEKSRLVRERTSDASLLYVHHHKPGMLKLVSVDVLIFRKGIDL